MFASINHEGSYRVNPRKFLTGSAFGHYMESIVGFILMDIGLLPYYHVVGSVGYDITAKNPHTGEITRIEVKASRQGQDGRYKFGLLKRTKKGRIKTDHRKADIIIFLTVEPDGKVTTFVVPTEVLSDVTQLTIPSDPSTYGGKIAAYRNDFSPLL